MARDSGFAPTVLSGLRVGPDPSDQPRPIEDYYRDFLRVAPPAFDGISSSEIAELWLLQVDHALRKLRVPEECRVRFVERHLIGNASEWWCAHRVSLRVEHVHWPEFSFAFIARFTTPEHREEKTSGNRQIIQGTKTVAEYRMEFEALVLLLPALAPSEGEKIRLFLQGLRPSIRLALAVCDIREFEVAFDLAANVERTVKQCKEIKDHHKKPKKRERIVEPSTAPTARVLTCFHCHEEGHKRATCPQLEGKRQARDEKLGLRRGK